MAKLVNDPAVAVWPAVGLVGSYELLMTTIPGKQVSAVSPSPLDDGSASEQQSCSALAEREWVPGAKHPDTLRSLGNLGVAYRAAGRMSEAVMLLEWTLADREQVLGVEHPDTLRTRNSLRAAYSAAGVTSSSA